MENPKKNKSMEWPARNYPSPDYLSSSRKRLAPQLIYKGGILHKWGRKMVVVVDEGFFNQLPPLDDVDREIADIAWMVYGFQKKEGRYSLKRRGVRYTRFESALATMTTPEVGDVSDFVEYLKGRIAKGKTMGTPMSSGIAPEVEPLPDTFGK